MRAIASETRSHRLPCECSVRHRCGNEPSIVAVAEKVKMLDTGGKHTAARLSE